MLLVNICPSLHKKPRHLCVPLMAGHKKRKIASLPVHLFARSTVLKQQLNSSFTAQFCCLQECKVACLDRKSVV